MRRLLALSLCAFGLASYPLDAVSRQADDVNRSANVSIRVGRDFDLDQLFGKRSSSVHRQSPHGGEVGGRILDSTKKRDAACVDAFVSWHRANTGRIAFDGFAKPSCEQNLPVVFDGRENDVQDRTISIDQPLVARKRLSLLELDVGSKRLQEQSSDSPDRVSRRRGPTQHIPNSQPSIVCDLGIVDRPGQRDGHAVYITDLARGSRHSRKLGAGQAIGSDDDLPLIFDDHDGGGVQVSVEPGAQQSETEYHASYLRVTPMRLGWVSVGLDDQGGLTSTTCDLRGVDVDISVEGAWLHLAGPRCLESLPQYSDPRR